MPLEMIKKRRDFLALRHGRKAQSSAFLLVMGEVDETRVSTRVGYTVTKKMGSAVVRNRMKRRLRAVVADVFPEKAVAGADYVIIARRAALTKNYPQLLDDMKRALLRLSRDTK